MKGNDGKAARQRKLQQLCIISAGVAVCLTMLHVAGDVLFGSRSSAHDGVDYSAAQKLVQKIQEQPMARKIGRAAKDVLSLRQQQQARYGDIDTNADASLSGSLLQSKAAERLLEGKGPDSAKVLQRILSGELHLVDIDAQQHVQHHHDSATSGDPSFYSGFYAHFCPLDWKLQKQNPSQVPMFKDLLEKSRHCDPDERSSHPFDLRELVALLRQHDAREQEQAAHGDGEASIKVLDLSAVAFHESRCGSTLVANSLAAMSPAKHRVYSESSPPIKMVKLCDRLRCTNAQKRQLWRDIVYVMSRSNDPNEERVFFKFQSAMTTLAIASFHDAFPRVPWFFIYRDPVQVLMSHAKKGALESNGKYRGRAVCLRALSNPSEYMKDMLPRFGYNDGPSSLTLSEFCAAHLATLTEFAHEQIQSQLDNHDAVVGLPINYDGLIETLTDAVLPFTLQRALTQEERSNIEHVSSFYSKGGRTGRVEQKFSNDNANKEQHATEEYRIAATTFLQPSYDLLDEYSKRTIQAMKESI